MLLRVYRMMSWFVLVALLATALPAYAQEPAPPAPTVEPPTGPTPDSPTGASDGTDWPFPVVPTPNGTMPSPPSNGSLMQPPLATPPPHTVSNPVIPPPATKTGDPLPNVKLPSLSLDIAVAPDLLVVGETATFSVTVTNLSDAPAEQLVLSVPIPDKVTAQSGPTTNGKKSAWRWDVGRLDAHAQQTLSATFTVKGALKGGAVVFDVAATASNMSAPATWRGGALVAEKRAKRARTVFKRNQKTILQSDDGSVTVELPGDAADSALDLAYTPPDDLIDPADASGGTQSKQKQQQGARRGFGAFELTATDPQGNAVHQFKQPLKLTLHYTPEQLDALGLREATLGLLWFDEDQQRWVAVPSTLDPATNSVTAAIDHFSTWQLGDQRTPSEAYVPSLQGFQTSLFTGAATYRMPVEVPAGPGGLKPDISLSYSSAATDGPGGERRNAQAGPVGKGWSLDAGGYVARNISTVGDTWDYFSLVFGGRSFDVVRGVPTGVASNGRNCLDYSDANKLWVPCWTWHAVDENFAKVRAVAAGGEDYTWQAWTPDGTRYSFNKAVRTYDTRGVYVYKWVLTEVQDTHGNRITYEYAGPSYNCAGWTCEPTPTLWRVRWAFDTSGNARYQAIIGLADRSSGYTAGVDTQWDYALQGQDARYRDFAPREFYRVDSISVQSWPNGASNYQLVRQYGLRYASAVNSVATDDNGQRQLTLLQVQQIGNDGSSALPARTFTYGMDAGGSGNPRPAGYNRLKTVDNGYGGMLTFNYDHPWTQANDPNRWPLLRNYHRIRTVLRQDTANPSGGSSALTTYDYVSPAVNDGSNSATWWYARYPSNNQDNRTLLAHPENWEFRGHISVTVTTYDGSIADANHRLHSIKHTFYQGDAGCTPALTNNVVNETDSCFQEMRQREGWKGREYQTETWDKSALLERTSTSYTRVDLPFYGTDTTQSGNYKRAGLWRAFNAVQQTTVSAYEGGGTSQNRTTIYGYDINTGNTTRIEERGESGATARVTNRYYLKKDDATSYLVDRMWGENIVDGAGNLLALTHRFFDNTANPQAAPTKGDLLLERRYFDVTNLLGTDTRYGYDQYGNRTTTTTYAGAGSYNGSANTPGNGSAARVTTTEYDGVFHAYPIKVTNPLGHIEQANYDYRMGTITSVTDPNNNTTSAEYDLFGRISKLIKPGDSSASPTTSFAYFDNVRPVQYIVSPKDQPNGSMQLQYSYDGLGRLIQTKRESIDGGQNIVVDKRYDGLDRLAAESQARYVNETPATTFWSYSPPGSTLYRPTTTSYDALDRPLLISMPDGTTTEHHYGIVNDSGTLLRYDDVVDANRHRSQTRSDALGRLTQAQEISGDCGGWQYSCGGAYTSGWAASATTRYSYDGLDRLTQTRDAVGNVASMAYDSAGRKTSMSDPDMGGWFYSYDANGNLLNQIDAKGQTTTFGYDALDRVTSRIGFDPALGGFADTFESKSSNWAWGANQTVPYNDGGYNRLKSTGTGVDWSAGAGRAAYSLSDGSGVWLRFKVDSTNTQAHLMLEANDAVYKRLGVVANNGNLELEYTTDGTHWTYPGNLITNLKTNTWYDFQMTVDDVGGFSVVAYEEGNPAKRGVYRVPMPAGKTWRFGQVVYRNTAILDDYRESPGAAFRYDAGGDANGIGRRTSMVNHAAYTSWKYDARGRVKEATDYMAWMNQTRTFTWAYDSADRIAAIGYPNGEVTNYQYDAAGRPRQLCTNVWSGCYVTNATYTALDQPQQWSFGNGTVQNWEYDAPMQRLWWLKLGTASNPEQHLKQSYNYDNASNVKRIDDYAANANYNFSYDHRDRLTRSWTTSGGATTDDESYAYDAIGNMLQKGSVAYKYGSNLNGTGTGPHQVRQLGSQSLSYDANGNMLTGSSRTFTWNTQNQPTVITGADGVAEVYNYDADGERVTRTRGSQTTIFFEGLWEEVLNQGNRYYYPFNGQMVAMRDNTIGGAVFWLHGDKLGSVSATSDGSGTVTKQRFGPWGELRAGSGSINQTTLNYTGQRLDGTGLLYYHARYYDPALGRFLSPDSVVPGSGTLTVAPSDPVAADAWRQRGGGPANPQALNRYSYVLNNPVNATDPSGHYLERQRVVSSGISYSTVQGNPNAPYYVDGNGNTLRIDPDTGVLYRMNNGRRERLYMVTTSGVADGCSARTRLGCVKYVYEYDDGFQDFKAHVDTGWAAQESIIGNTVAGMGGGCATGAVATSPSGPGAGAGCVIGAAIGGAGTLVASGVYASAKQYEEYQAAVPIFNDMYTVGRPQPAAGPPTPQKRK